MGLIWFKIRFSGSKPFYSNLIDWCILKHSFVENSVVAFVSIVFYLEYSSRLSD